MGEFIFGNEGADMILGSNRELMVEMCRSVVWYYQTHVLTIPEQKQVTFRRQGTSPLQAIDLGGFARLDFFLVPQAKMQDILDVRSDRTEPLASHHFMATASLGDYRLEATRTHARSREDVSLLGEQYWSQKFAIAFSSYAAQKGDIKNHLDTCERYSHGGIQLRQK